MHVCVYMKMAASLPSTKDPLQQREKLYLLAVGYFRNADYSRSRDLVDRCLTVCVYPSYLCLSVCYFGFGFSKASMDKVRNLNLDILFSSVISYAWVSHNDWYCLLYLCKYCRSQILILQHNDLTFFFLCVWRTNITDLCFLLLISLNQCVRERLCVVLHPKEVVLGLCP